MIWFNKKYFIYYLIDAFLTISFCNIPVISVDIDKKKHWIKLTMMFLFRFLLPSILNSLLLSYLLCDFIFHTIKWFLLHIFSASRFSRFTICYCYLLLFILLPLLLFIFYALLWLLHFPSDYRRGFREFKPSLLPSAYLNIST